MSSRTSTSWSTSDAPPGAATRLAAWLRLTHPFPSVLDGLVCAAIALVAGAEPELAARIGVAMTLLQLGIGTVNDVVDAPADTGRKPGKPIPAGLVEIRAARALAVALFVAGVVVSASAAVLLVPLAAIVIAIGLAYDLRLKGTAWSWLPFAAGIPLLPVFGWLGAVGSLPAAFLVLIPAAVAAGAALAIGNSLVDVERDHSAGQTSIAATLGRPRAAAVAAALFALVDAAAVVSAWAGGATPASLFGLGLAGMAAVVASASAAGAGPSGREWAWRTEAVAIGALAVVWLAAIPLT